MTGTPAVAKSGISARPKVFLFGSKASSKFEQLKGSPRDPFDFEVISSIEQAQQALKNPENIRSIVAIVALAAVSDIDRCIQILSEYELESRMTSRILAADSMNLDIFTSATNEAHPHFCLSIAELENRWKEILSTSWKFYSNYLERHQLLKQSTQQLRELESLNSNLEIRVLERTRHIEASKEEEDEKLAKGRNLIKFIKELAQVLDFENLLQAIRKDFRKFHRVSDPVLVYQISPDSFQLVSLQGTQANFSRTQDRFPFQNQLGFAQVEVGQFLANHFGRPFVKVFYLPLEVQFVRQNSFSAAGAAIIWEVGLGEVELSVFKNFLLERAESIAITVDRLMLENELIQFSYRWERTFDGFRDPIAIVDFEYEVLRSNKKFSDKFDHRKCYEKFAHRETPCEGCPIHMAVETGLPQSGTIQLDSKTIEVHSYPIVLENGARITNVVNQYADITQSRELYLRMLQSEKIGAIGLLAGHIAHELNNPLTGIRSLAQVLASSTEDSALKSDLQEIERATQRSQKIIKNLLDFSSETPQEARAVSWNEIIEKTAPMLKSAMRLHRQQIHLASEKTYFKAEPSLMQQVYFNLVNNACQAMKSPGTLSIETESTLSKDEPSGEMKKVVVLRIRDTGTGVPLEIQQKIFEPFFTTKKEGIGTGLGLSLSYKIVEKFRGKIVLVESSDKGTVFEVQMPEMEYEEDINN